MEPRGWYDDVVRVRFAPSPTGDLHLGGAWTALAAWALARSEGGCTVLRVEDLDPPRVVRGSAERIAEDLAWLGLDWDESPAAGGSCAPYTQSERGDVYADAIARLASSASTYACDCSRAEIARVASAPHAGEELRYPGTCRDLGDRRELKRPASVRLRVAEGAREVFDDLLRGPVEQRVDEVAGDFVLQRGDGVYSYQLAVAVDDAAMGITHVVRADDLLASTPRQLHLMRLLGYRAVPRYAHVPMVVFGGDRLAKRAGATSVRALRERGTSAEEIVGQLAHGLGLVSGAPRPMLAADVARALTPVATWRTDAWPVPESLR